MTEQDEDMDINIKDVLADPLLEEKYSEEYFTKSKIAIIDHFVAWEDTTDQAICQQLPKRGSVSCDVQDVGSSGTSEDQNHISEGETSSHTHARIRRYKCTICNKKVAKLQRHMQTHSGIKNFKCAICAKEFIEKGNLLKHMKTHTGERKFNCTVCNKTFAQKSNLTIHIKTHIGDRKYNCSICNKNFLLKNHLVRHKKIHVGIEVFKCTICNKEFSLQFSLNRHMKVHTGVIDIKEPQQQRFCEVLIKVENIEETIAQEGNINKENTDDLLLEKPDIKDEFVTCEAKTDCTLYQQLDSSDVHDDEMTGSNTNTDRCKCANCSKQLSTKYCLKRHMEIHSSVKNFNCSICIKEFSRNSDLQVHLNTQHTTRITKFKCTICDKEFLEQQHLKTHVMIHSGLKEFNCTICNKEFLLKATLNRHMKVHTGVQDISDPQKYVEQRTVQEENDLTIKVKDTHQEIDDSLLEGQDAEQHIKSEFVSCEDKIDQEISQQLYNCELSNLSGTSKGKNHEFVQRSEDEICSNNDTNKMFQCVVCSKEFTDKTRLHRHLKIHSDIKEFKCTICNKCFTYKCNLSKHMIYHNKIKDYYKCEICNKLFKYKNYLSNHMNMHTRDKQYECEICNKLYFQKGSLRKHIVKMHS